MTKGQLKHRLENPTLFQGIMNLAKDPTLENSRKDQMLGLLFIQLVVVIGMNVIIMKKYDMSKN